MEGLSNFFDSELLLMIMIVIVGTIVLRIVWNLFRRHRILKVIIVAVFIISILAMVLQYVMKNEDIYTNKEVYYIYGKVEFVTNALKKIEVSSNKSNFIKGGKGKIEVKFPSNILIVNKKNEEISINDLKYGDIVQVICKEKETTDENNQVNAVKIYKKNE